MRTVVRVLPSILILALATAAHGGTLERAVDDALAAPLRDRRFAGVVLVAKDGRTLLRKAYGLADRERGIAHTPETPFMIMSVSKQLTAALVLRLVAQGRLRLDDRVADHLADWPVEWDRVTIAHLLSHSAGTDIDTTYFWLVRHHPRYWPEAGAPPPYEPKALRTEPGTAFLYSNVGYTLLSMIASAAGGKPFDELLRDEVLCPLGMTHTRPQREEPVARARGYRRTADGFALWEQRTVDIVGAGDLVSTVDDLLKFDAALSDDRFLPAPLRAAMFTPHVTGKLGGVGYGWFVREGKDGRQLQYHAGDGAGFRAWNYRVSEGGLMIVVLSNVGEPDAAWLTALREAAAQAKE